MKNVMTVSVLAIFLAPAASVSAFQDKGEAMTERERTNDQDPAEAAAAVVEREVPQRPVVRIPPPSPPSIKAVEAAYPLDPRPKSLWKLFRPVDYPASAWVAEQEGSVGYSVTVAADGSVTGCEVTRSSGFEALDKATCEVVRERGEFIPAYVDAETPVRGVYEGTRTWRRATPQLPPVSVTYQYDQTADGQQTNCKVLRLEGEVPERVRKDLERMAERKDGCIVGRPDRYGIPYRDENGIPVAKRVTLTVDVVVEDVTGE